MTRIIFLAFLLVSARMAVGQRISTVKIGDNRYFVSWQNPYSPQLNYHLAYQYCRTIAMELVSLETAEEAQSLTDYLRSSGAPRDFWTSGNVLGSESWLWLSNGSPLNATFNYWRDGIEPARSEAACLLQAEQAQTWRATNCNEAHHFICEQTRCYFYNFNAAQQGVAN